VYQCCVRSADATSSKPYKTQINVKRNTIKDLTTSAEEPIQELVYLHLAHGRKSRTQDMEEYGEDGPLLGPFLRVQIQYADEIRCFLPNKSGICRDGEFSLGVDREEQVLYYNGMWYGTYSVHPAGAALKDEYLNKNIQVPNNDLAIFPKENK